MAVSRSIRMGALLTPLQTARWRLTGLSTRWWMSFQISARLRSSSRYPPPLTCLLMILRGLPIRVPSLPGLPSPALGQLLAAPFRAVPILSQLTLLPTLPIVGRTILFRRASNFQLAPSAAALAAGSALARENITLPGCILKALLEVQTFSS